MEPIGFSLALLTLLTSFYMIYYGVKRIQGRFVNSPAEFIYLLYIRITRGEKAAHITKEKIVRNRRWNLIIGISAFISSPAMIYVAYLFYLISRYK